MFFFFFQAEDGIRDLVRSRGLGDVYKRQEHHVGVAARCEGEERRDDEGDGEAPGADGVRVRMTVRMIVRMELLLFLIGELIGLARRGGEGSRVRVHNERASAQNRSGRPDRCLG